MKSDITLAKEWSVDMPRTMREEFEIKNFAFAHVLINPMDGHLVIKFTDGSLAHSYTYSNGYESGTYAREAITFHKFIYKKYQARDDLEDLKRSFFARFRTKKIAALEKFVGDMDRLQHSELIK